MSPRWRFYYLGYLLALPMTLIGIAAALILGARRFAWVSGVIECVTPRLGWAAAMTFGQVVMYRDPYLKTIGELAVHERTHVVQGFVLGPLQPILYGVFFAYAWARNPAGGFEAAYRANPFERHAYAVGDRAKPGDWGWRT